MNNTLDSEKYTLGTLLFNNNLTIKAMDTLKAEDFYRNSHQLIYAAIENLYKENLKFDVFVIINKLDKEIKSKVITQTEIMSLTSCCEVGTFKTHIGIVKEQSRKREIKKLCESVIRSEENSETNIFEIQNKLLEITSTNTNNTYCTMAQAVENTITRIEEAFNSKEGFTGIASGVSSIDRALNGFARKELTVLGARPSMGKTALTIELIRNTKANVMFVQLDMAIEGMVQRMFSTDMEIENGRVGRGSLDEKEWQQLSRTASQLAKKENIFFFQPTSPTLTQIMMRAKEIKLKHGLDWIIVDHIGKIKPETKGSRYEQMTVISNGIKGIAIELDVNMTALCQLSRMVESRQDKRPTLSDLRDTGAIEEDADNIGMLYRDGYYRAREDRIPITIDTLEVDFQKVRNGRLGLVEFEYNLGTQGLAQIYRN